MIEIVNVTKQYKDVKAVEDVTLTIQQGEIFGIIGYSGAGKSTLLRCLNMLEEPTAGQIFIDGKEMTSLTKER